MKKLHHWIELAFWNAVIPLLSESALVRGSLREVHHLYTSRNNWLLYLILSWAAMALVIGFILGRSGALY